MKKNIIIIGLIIVFILLANYTGLKTILSGLPIYKYTTELNEFNSSEVPWKGIKFENTLSSFERFKKKNPNTNDTILYRTFKRNPLKFWYWHDYLTHKRYKLPYKSKNE